MTEEQLKNKELVERYPFLHPWSRWTREKDNNYDYSYTELDAMPDGWRKAFGEQMCEEIREELIRCNCLDDYHIVQIKEKFGMLRWYDVGYPKDSKIDDIIWKYEDLSSHTCMLCGRPAETKREGWWVETICDDCKKKIDEEYRREE